jgi:two-component system, response regulator / RNA-binding antiterminator
LNVARKNSRHMLNVLIVECGITNSMLESGLTKDKVDFLKIPYSPLFLSFTKESRPDVVIFNLDTPSDRLIADLHLLDQQLPLPVIMFSSDSSNETINKVIKAEVSAYIVEGFPQDLTSIIRIAIANFKHRQTLKNALEDARTQLEDRKQIDRAKAILIKTQNFSENEAYHTLRKLAMDRNITVGEMSRNVIAMAELLK